MNGLILGKLILSFIDATLIYDNNLGTVKDYNTFSESRFFSLECSELETSNNSETYLYIGTQKCFNQLINK
jgi:hypothetical protein